jgi:hypothetical protein
MRSIPVIRNSILQFSGYPCTIKVKGFALRFARTVPGLEIPIW